MTKKQKKWLCRIVISLTLFLVIFITDKIVKLDQITNYSYLLPLALYLIIYILIGYDVIFKAIRNIINGQVFDENFLMVIATIGAFIISEYSEAVAVLLFYQVGEFFQNYAVSASRTSIASLMDIRPDYANLLDGSELKEVAPEEVIVGDIIVVKPGEKVPLDGVIIEGDTLVDTKALTGESVPERLRVNDFIMSGSININGIIKIKVQKEFYDSTVSKILDLVENAQTKKSKSENFITKFAKYYTPIVVILAILLAVIPSLITKDVEVWVYRSLNFLVVSCPCAIVISVPLSFFSGLGACSKNGILVKGSNYLEKMSKSNIFVLDKTGTLTKGTFKITKIEPLGYTEEEVLYYARICEKNSNHPIAISVMNDINPNLIPDAIITEVSGCGIIARLDGDTLYAGNEKLLNKYNIKYPQQNDSEIGTIIYICKNEEYIGKIIICDEIKKESYQFINELNMMNLRSVMLTGDSTKVASSVASELSITSYKASLLPQDKVLELETILENKRKNDIVCFIGDGINDAPVLTRSDIGISMGQIGSDAAIEASDIVLMNDDLTGIIKTKKIANKTMKIVKENIVFALTVKILVLILSIFGLTNMWISVFADVGVAVIAILNALRVNSTKSK